MVPPASRCASIVVDLGFGDSGKGTVVDWLVRTRSAELVVRWNGGAQAGHTVVLDDGRHHTFSQFGAGTFVGGVRTHLAEGVVIHPTALLVEARVLDGRGVVDALSRLSIARSARVITPYHQAANRLRELARGSARHGSCGVGVGEAVRDALEHPDDVLRARDLVGDRDALRARLARLRDRVRASLPDIEDVKGASAERAVFDDPPLLDRWMDAIAPFRERGLVVPDDALASMWRDRSIVLEGAQGVLLDEHAGFHPHTTWGTCTLAPALALLAAHGWDGRLDRIGVLRAYLTRHGEGPFPTEEPELAGHLPEHHNEGEGWQGTFRRGWPDLVLARYALEACGALDGLGITHLDRLAALPRWKAARGYHGVEGPGELAERDTGGDVIALRSGDLAHQARLGAALRRAKPVFTELPREPSAYVERIEDELGLPVTITSYGPAARDKRART